MLDIKLPDWRQQDRQSNKTLAFGLWNGKISIQVYDSNNMMNKMFRRNFDDSEIKMIEHLISKMISASPEMKQSIQFQKYDPQSKGFRMESVFSIEKDSKMCYRISVTDCTKQQTHTFTLKARATMTTGSEPLKDENLSAIKIETLKDWLQSAKFWAPATVQPVDKSKFGNRGGGNNYGNRGGYNGGSQAPAAPAAEAGSGDGGDSSLPF